MSDAAIGAIEAIYVMEAMGIGACDCGLAVVRELLLVQPLRAQAILW